MEKELHAEHRKRIRARYLKEGLEGFEPHQALELLLCYAVPRRDVNPLAHRLIERFGSIEGVLNAQCNEIMSVDGAGENVAVLLSLVGAVGRNAGKEVRERAHLGNAAQAGEYAAKLCGNADTEHVYFVALDARNRVIRALCLANGGTAEVSLQPRTVAEAALYTKACHGMLIHNHPGGSLWPSQEDRIFTRQICMALMSISVELMDHIIVCADKYYSFAGNGDMEKIRMEVCVRTQSVERVQTKNISVGEEEEEYGRAGLTL